MYNTQQRIEDGRQILKHNPRRDLTAWEINKVKEQAADVYEFGESMFLLGVAIGARIAAQEGRQ